jgi:hypothetical protein
MKKEFRDILSFVILFALTTSPVFSQNENTPKSILVIPLQSATIKKTSLAKLNRALTSKINKEPKFEIKSLKSVQSSEEYKLIKNQNCQSSGCIRRLAVLANSDLALSGYVESKYNIQQLTLSLFHVPSGYLLGHTSFPERELDARHIELALAEVFSQYETEKTKIKNFKLQEGIPGILQLVADKVGPDSLEITIKQNDDYSPEKSKMEVCIAEDAAGCLPFDVSEVLDGDKSSVSFSDLEYNQTYFISVRNVRTATDKGAAYSPVSVLRQATSPISVTQPPQFDKAPGYYTDSFPLKLLSATDAATICYTTDNSEPSCIREICRAGQTYKPGQTIYQSSTVKALSCKMGYANSSITVGDFRVEPKNKDGLPRLSILPFTRVFENTRSNKAVDKRIRFFDQNLQSRQKFYAVNQESVAQIPEYQAITSKRPCNDVNCIISMSKFLNCRYAIQGYFTYNNDGQSIEAILLEVGTGNYLASAAVNSDLISEEQITLLIDKLIADFELEVKTQEAIANSRFNPEYYNILLPGVYDSKIKKPNYMLLGVSAGAIALSTVLGLAAAEQINKSNTTKSTADFTKAEQAVTASSMTIMATAGLYLVNGFMTVGRHPMFIPAEIPVTAEGGGGSSDFNSTTVFVEQANDRFTQSQQTRVSVNFKF